MRQVGGAERALLSWLTLPRGAAARRELLCASLALLVVQLAGCAPPLGGPDAELAEYIERLGSVAAKVSQLGKWRRRAPNATAAR